MLATIRSFFFRCLVLPGVLSVAGVWSVYAQPCLTYDDYLNLHPAKKNYYELTGISYADGFAYATYYPTGTFAYSLQDPRRPTQVSRIAPGTRHAATLAGNGMLCLARADGIRVYDVSDPSAAVLLSILPAEERVADLAWAGRHLIALWEDGHLRKANLGDPATPYWSHEGRVAEVGVCLAVAGSTIYVGGNGFVMVGESSWDGIAAVRIGAPELPLEPAGVVASADRAPCALETAGSFLWSIGNGLQGYVLADPLRPTLIASEPFFGLDLSIDSDRLYLASGNAGLRVLDISNPAHPVEHASPAGGGSFSMVEVENGQCMVGGGNAGMFSMAGWDTESPSLLLEGVIGTSYLFAVASGNQIWALTAGGRFDVLEMDQWPLLEPIASLNLNCESPFMMKASGDRCLISTRGEGIFIVDMNDSTAPTCSRAQIECLRVNDVDLYGDILLMAGNSGTVLMDVSDMDHPGAVSLIVSPNTGPALSLAVQGNRVVVFQVRSFNEWTLLLVDISDPASPVNLDEVSRATVALDLVFRDGLVYVTSPVGLDVYDGIVDDQIHLHKTISIEGGAKALALLGDRGYMVNDDRAIILGIDNPLWPVVLGAVPVSYHRSIAATPYGTLVVGVGGEMCVLYPECETVLATDPVMPPTQPTAIPTCTTINSAYTNPFNPSVKIDMSLAEPGHVQVSVHDLLGRVVCVLADRAYTNGSHSLVWNGCDSAGRGCPSGTYLVRLVSGDLSDSRKILLTR